MTESLGGFFDLRLNIGWANNRDDGNWRRHHAHYGVTVMILGNIVYKPDDAII